VSCLAVCAGARRESPMVMAESRVSGGDAARWLASSINHPARGVALGFACVSGRLSVVLTAAGMRPALCVSTWLAKH
jgi:hypothetical protein